MSTFESTKRALPELLNEILKGKLQLPDFQRGWVKPRLSSMAGKCSPPSVAYPRETDFEKADHAAHDAAERTARHGYRSGTQSIEKGLREGGCRKQKMWAAAAFQASKDGATRARITTLNARWGQAAERRDELKRLLREAEAE